MRENIFANKNIDFHNYVINIHSFGLKPIYDLQSHFFFFVLVKEFFLYDL